MESKIKKVVFTIAYGKEKYTHMAEILGKSIKKYSPDIEFKILTDKDITKKSSLNNKNNRRGKIEICKNLNNLNTQYIFIDSDSFVFCDLNQLFSCIKKGKIIITWKQSPDGKWDGIKELDFPKACKNAGIEGDIKAYHLNSGFMMWQGGVKCFEKALELFDHYEFNDRKGIRDDEYYINAGIQLTNTGVIPAQDIAAIPLKVYWVGHLSIKDGKLHSSKYKEQGYIQHYGGHNYGNYFVKKIIHNIENNKSIEDSHWYEYIRYNFFTIDNRKKFISIQLSKYDIGKMLIKSVKNIMNQFKK